MRKVDLAYVAGIIDGEGCISLNFQNKNNSVFAIRVQVGNTNEWLLQWLKFAFGGRTVLVNDKRMEIRGWKPLYRWYLRNAEALDFLKLIYPYLRIKRTQAEIAIKVLEMRRTKYRRFSESEKAIVEVQRILMGNLNKTGNIES